MEYSTIASMMLDIREYEAARIIAKLVGDKHNVLNIGCSWGRDYFHLSKLGKKVVNLDMAKQPHLKNFVLADATKLPFSSKIFDAVLLLDVIEHLYDDVLVLKEIRRVLKDDGIIILSVPFFSDKPEYHVRVHSPKTIRRLLSHHGFKILDYIERGGLISFAKYINPMLRHPIARKIRIADRITEFDFKIGKSGSKWLKKSKYYGCYILVKKRNAIDFRKMQIEEFGH